MNALTEWFFYTSAWYILLLAVGIIFFPITRCIFGRFYDYGYGFSKAIGIAFLSYTMFALGTVRLLPFAQWSLYLLLAAFLYISYRLYKRSPIKKGSHVSLMIAEEALFLLAFFVWSYVRAQEPAIRGLEKFMDFGFINSVLRGDFFPSKDMWLAGKSINYYYFGHITGAVMTKLSFIPSFITYNLILAQLFALSLAGTFTLGFNIAYHAFKRNMKLSFISATLSAFLVNMAGNLHPIYAFTQGYPNEKPVPFWKLEAKYTLTDLLHPIEALDKLPFAYWYPNATRFIPLTIHEFPLYSYVVADLHGHVFDIPFVLITLGLLYSLFLHTKGRGLNFKKLHPSHMLKNIIVDLPLSKGYLGYAILTGFFLSILLMTNAFDAPIYLALTGVIFLAMFGFSQELFLYGGIIALSFFVFNIPFSAGFEPFATGLGFNCVPETLADTLRSTLSRTTIGERFVFENKCQTSQWWQILTLWGFFWFNFAFFIVYTVQQKFKMSRTATFVLILFSFSTLLIAAPEFVYAKDIYPSHFRANTMFKLGYQAFIMFGLASAFTFTAFKSILRKKHISKVYIILFLPLFILVSLYPAFAIESFYGSQNKTPILDGQAWAAETYGEYHEIINFFNEKVDGQPTILEAQGDSYTDYNVVSAYTGLPTVGGWFVHEWLWRGDSHAVGDLSPDIQMIYAGSNPDETKRLLRQHAIEYVVIGKNEREKYVTIDESKFEALGKVVFRSKVNNGVVYQIPIDTY